VANKIYIKKLESVIFHLLGSTATHVETVPVHEVFRGQTVWQGKVEVFDLADHPKAKRCYAWYYKVDGEEKFVTVVEIPPVTSPETAVKVAVANEVKEARKAMGKK
jgi:hypothetical protein